MFLNSYTGDNIEIVDLLYQHKTDINIQNSDKVTPLHFAAFGGNKPIEEYVMILLLRADITMTQ